MSDNRAHVLVENAPSVACQSQAENMINAEARHCDTSDAHAAEPACNVGDGCRGGCGLCLSCKWLRVPPSEQGVEVDATSGARKYRARIRRRRAGGATGFVTAASVLLASSAAGAAAAAASSSSVATASSSLVAVSRKRSHSQRLLHRGERRSRNSSSSSIRTSTSAPGFVPSSAVRAEPTRRRCHRSLASFAGPGRNTRRLHRAVAASTFAQTTNDHVERAASRAWSGRGRGAALCAAWDPNGDEHVDGSSSSRNTPSPSRHSSYSSSTALRMVSATGRPPRGEGFSGDFQRAGDAWNRGRARQRNQRNSSPNGGVGDSGEPGRRSSKALRSQQQERGASPSESRRSRLLEGVVSWTPKQEGQGSWDRQKAAIAGLEPPLWRVDLKRGVYTGDIKLKQPLGLDLTECSDGVCVSKVRPGSCADEQGIMAGDRVVATSATLGDVLWEKNTVDGILSAVGTRLVLSDTVTLRIERPLDARQLAAARFQESVTQTFEITMERPPGLMLEQVWDTSSDGEGEPEAVVVAGIVPGSPADRSGAVEVGDRVVAVGSSIGNIMWPYKRLEGVLSAIELHVGSTVNLRFQRVVEMGSWKDPSSAVDEGTIDSTLKIFRERGGAKAAAAAAAPPRAPSPAEAATAAATAVATAAATSAGFVASAQPAQQAAKNDEKNEARTIVLERCAALVRSYGMRKQAIAVDNLLERMQQAGVQMDARFLNSVVIAYLLCKEPQKAVDTFHAVTGIVWPDLPAWPDLATGPVSTAVPVAPGKRGHDTVTLDPSPTSQRAEFPEEFLQLKAGPPLEQAEALEALSSWGGLGGERFLQMREVEPLNGSGGGGSAHVPCTCEEDAKGVPCEQAVSTPGGAAAAAAVATAAPLRRPAYGEYVGQCKPNALLVATVVKAHGRRRRVDDACRTVLRMLDWGLKPDVAVFNSLAAAAVWNGRMDLALEVVLGGVMKAWGVKPNQLSFNTMMDAYARQGNVKNVLKIYNYMQAEGVAPDVITTTIVVKAQVSSGDVGAAMATLVEMMKVSKLRESLDAFPFNTIIQGLMKTLQWEKAMDLFRSMAYHNVKPDLITFNSLMAGLNRARRAAIAVELFEEMQDAGIEPDVYTFSSLVSAYAKLGDVASAVQVLSDMPKSGVKPNGYTCSAVMQACIKGGQPDTALEVHDKLIAKGGVRADEVISTLLVEAHAMLGQFDEAFQVITAMGKLGQDNKIPFNHLLRECVLAGDWSRASQAVKRMIYQANGGKGARFDANTFNAVSEIPRGYDGTEGAAWPRLMFLVETKDAVLAKGWDYSSALYLAILQECISREDYIMAAMVVEDRKSGKVFVRPSDREEVEYAEDKIRFKMLARNGRYAF